MSRAASAATSISLRCPICWDTFCSPVLTPCGHRFCEACVKTALTVKKECPSCRQPVKSHRALRVDTAFFAATESSGVRSAVAAPLLDECLASCDAEWNCRGCTLANPAAAERCATYRGEVASVNNDGTFGVGRTFGVAYEDGDEEEAVPLAELFHPAAEAGRPAHSDEQRLTAARERARRQTPTVGFRLAGRVYKHGNKYRARLDVPGGEGEGGGKSRYVGSFDTVEEAAAARAAAAEEQRRSDEAARAPRLARQAEAARQQAISEGLQLEPSSSNTSTGFRGVVVYDAGKRSLRTCYRAYNAMHWQHRGADDHAGQNAQWISGTFETPRDGQDREAGAGSEVQKL
ncbi:hypothetical protein EMIHUDRAFT_224927 [Emiliania huxleyi CCMP1516]|uniref:RING-type domain-containing protein n=2 Tax=Emiliania huxleyi TaxID=2903 RepID=A0A0D3KQA0_EMIH1|nr:hypothetical protein EMIHUDRAFT_224927 [Emiliania huxleyi CCMP1516]EOD37935.1 hypothetical protein EMIHUDRAFT_224927 [Emiliania huxleyi CCMP1516]|eukprot:XP_005790364.1 hypothetical protein EMIHUDRAFT_224927 [Emiliania huxleyi CCMP1516]